jgi:hypothetical protein
MRRNTSQARFSEPTASSIAAPDAITPATRDKKKAALFARPKFREETPKKTYGRTNQRPADAAPQNMRPGLAEIKSIFFAPPNSHDLPREFAKF